MLFWDLKKPPAYTTGQDTAYIEAHGTGTKAGDMEELTAISKAFSEGSAPGLQRISPLHVGSVKGNIGHTENVSGLASILKAVLMLEHLQIPGTAGLRDFKHGLPVQSMHFPRDLTSWPQGRYDWKQMPPRVSINSFGFGGTNAHAILERKPAQYGASLVNPNPTISERPLLLALSANTESSLQALLQSYSSWIERHPNVPLQDLSFTLCNRRSVFAWRFSCVASSHTTLMKHLQDTLNTSNFTPPIQPPSVVFIFTGQGAQWLGMARELLSSDTASPLFRDSIHQSRDILFDLGADWDLERELLRPLGESTRLNTAQLAQPVTTAVQLALIALLRSFNIVCQTVIGHSSGEIAAAYTAGYLTAKEALEIAYHRGYMAEAAKKTGIVPGAMLSVGLGEVDVQRFLQDLARGNASIACINSPQSVTISGDAAAVDEVASRIEESNAQGGSAIFHRRLAVDTAYHSHHMQAVAEQYRSRLGDVQPMPMRLGHKPNHIDFISSVSGSFKSSGFGAQYWVENLVSPVRFSDAIETFISTSDVSKHNVFLEIGPHSSLAGPVRQCIMSQTGTRAAFDYHPILQRKVDAITSTLSAAGRLFERGVTVDLAAVSAMSLSRRHAVVLDNLPAYTCTSSISFKLPSRLLCLAHRTREMKTDILLEGDHSQKHYFESRISREYRLRQDPYHDLLGVRAMDATSIEPRWRHLIGVKSLPWLRHHLIDQQIIFPGSGYICMVMEAVRQIQNQRHPDTHLEAIIMRNVSFLRGLVVPDLPGERIELQLSLIPQPGMLLSFHFRIAAHWGGEWREHCTGAVKGIQFDQNAPNGTHIVRSAYLASAVPNNLSSKVRSLEPEKLYNDLHEAGNNYGPTFSTIRRYSLDSDMSSATAKVEIPDTAAIMPGQYQQPHLIHPTTLDTLVHTCLPVAWSRLGKASIMPVHIDEITACATTVLPHEPKSIMDVSTTLTSIHHRTARADVSASTGNAPILMVSGMELRSLNSNAHTDTELSEGLEICYKLDWRADIDFLRAEDLFEFSKTAEVFRNIVYKRPNLAVIEIPCGDTDLAVCFFSSLTGPENTWPTYEYTSATSEALERARKRLLGYPVQYRALTTETDVVTQGFQSNSYDVVLISDPESVYQAASLVDQKGVVIGEVADVGAHVWIELFHKARLEVQLHVRDEIRGGSIILARKSVDTEDKPSRSLTGIKMLTHSNGNTIHKWVADIEMMLRGGFGDVSRFPITEIDIEEKGNEDCPVLIVEDQSQPILSDPTCFAAVQYLLAQSHPMVWLSPVEPLSMHQVTGVARTAHAENETLHLTTIHMDQDTFSSESDSFARLLKIISKAVEPGNTFREREYLIDRAGTVKVPRLLHHGSLNRAIGGGPAPQHEVQTSPFLEPSRPLVLRKSGNQENSLWSEPIAFQEVNEQTRPLAEDEIEFETRAFALTKAGLTECHHAYAGKVTQVGPAVNDLSIGDQIVAVDKVLGANRLVISRKVLGKLPSNISPATGAMCLIPIMEASHALRSLAHLSSTDKVLVHGSLTPLGRATIAVARSIGATVSVSAASADEARLSTQELGVSPDLIARITPFQSPKSQYIGDVDLVVQAAQETNHVPGQILAYLKPFGSFVILGHNSTRRNDDKTPAFDLPRNCAAFSCEIMELLKVSPEVVPDLILQATAALSHYPVDGLDCCLRPVSHVSRAIRLIETGVSNLVILEADKASLAPILLRPQTGTISWHTNNASYIITGGLGDLGRRLLCLMAQRGAKHLVTLSRRSCPVEQHHEIQMQLRTISPECNLYCLSCDLTETESVQEAAREISALGIPPVRGIIHSAALLKVSEFLRFYLLAFIPLASGPE